MAMSLTVDDLGKLLHSAASSGDVDEIKRLLAAGAPVDWKSTKDNGSTALILAAAKNHVDAADYLISHGASVEAQTTEGWTALMVAAGRGHAEVSSLLLDHGADMDAEDENFNSAIVHSSAGGFPGWAKDTLNLFARRSNTAKLVESHRVATEALEAKVAHLRSQLQAQKEQMVAALAAKQEQMDALRAAHDVAAAEAADKLQAVTRRIQEFKDLARKC